MDVYEGAHSAFPGHPAFAGMAAAFPINGAAARARFPQLPPILADHEAERSDPRIRRALEWASEAHQLIASLQERVAYLETLTTTDELTGMLNRRGFFEHFRRELAHAKRDASAGGMLGMVDLNGFKAINDSLGHAAGDAMLCRVGKLLCGAVRSQDVVARLGGDEFAILLTTIDPTSGSQRIAALTQGLNAETAVWRGYTIPVSLSIGAAPYGPHDREEIVMRAADSAMYAHKLATAAPRGAAIARR